MKPSPFGLGVFVSPSDRINDTFIYGIIIHQYIKLKGVVMTEASRPLDALNKARGKRVIVELKNGKQYIGLLNAFDIHINVVLEDAEEHIEEVVEKEVDGKKVSVKTGKKVLNRKLGTIFVRGDTITIISTD